MRLSLWGKSAAQSFGHCRFHASISLEGRACFTIIVVLSEAVRMGADALLSLYIALEDHVRAHLIHSPMQLDSLLEGHSLLHDVLVFD